MDRGTCWAITINNPTEEDMTTTLPAKWTIIGQMEKGKDGTPHYQAMLTTPQVRFSAIKKVYPRAHIELAKNKAALQKYVKKEDSRISSVPDRSSNIPTLFDYQHTVASYWDDDEFTALCDEHYSMVESSKVKFVLDDVALAYVDKLVAQDIEDGLCGVEFIAINPMWRSAWKKFWKQMVARERAKIKISSGSISCEPSTPLENESSESAKSSVAAESPLSTEATFIVDKVSLSE